MEETMEEELLGGSVPAPCPHFGRCGGCQYQHIDYGKQLLLKRQYIERLFSGHLLPGCFPRPVIPSPKIYGYRTKITPHYGRIRCGEEPIGFRESSGNCLVDISYCPIATDGINAKLPDLRRRIRETPTKRGGTALLRQGGDVITDNPRDLLCEEVSGKQLHFIAGEFFQNNASILDSFATYVSRMIADDCCDFLVDAYCGVGFFSILAADYFEKVVGIEVCQQTVSMGKLNASTNEIKNVEFLIGSAEAIFAAIAFAPQRTTVLLDPPRSGAGVKFIEQLLRFSPRRIVYVACGPTSQANEIFQFLPHYTLQEIQPIDLFPQTKHIENVVTLLRRE
ncbi:MAG: SAM-dependent methyltransferase [Puniceicoccales bacterium]|jgi:23S rRNA (uracil1939-C5)-methyltransferase/tRNA (uracil-5-)-methyltransferase|nr:SAM-dependent methyltransferase [Puniceicoccales bacterium]